MQNDADLVKELGVISEIVYKDDYFVENNPDTIINQSDHPQLQNTYTVRATRDLPSGFQAMFLEEIDEGGNGTGTTPQQMKDGMAFVKEIMDNPNYSLNATNTVFTGHSLGGAIAGMASYVYGFDAYTYNGFGIQNMLWDADDTYATNFSGEIQYDEFGSSDIYYSLGEYLEDLGVVPLKEQNRIINIVQDGYSHSNLVGGILTDIVSGQVGETHFVINHTGNIGGGLDNHGIAGLNESIAVYNNVLSLFPDEDYDSLSETLRDVQPETRKVERFLESLGALGSVADNAADHVAWSEAIGQSGLAGLTLTSLSASNASALQAGSSSLEGMYALRELLPFTITGADYSHLNQNGELNPDNYSDQYIRDRAAFLYFYMHEGSFSNTPDDMQFYDTALGIDAYAGNGTPDLSDRHYIFGNLEGELIEGNSKEDHLYGMDGDDTLTGNGGNDYLEGGKGQDTMDGGSGDDIFYIQGTDEAYDIFKGGTGTDTIQGSGQNDTIRVNSLSLAENSIEKIDGGAEDYLVENMP